MYLSTFLLMFIRLFGAVTSSKARAMICDHTFKRPKNTFMVCIPCSNQKNLKVEN